MNVQRTLRRLRPAPRTPWLRAFTAGLLALGTGCSEPSKAVSVDDVLARDRAAALFLDDKHKDARQAMQPLVTAGDAAVEDLIRAANIEFADGKPEAARPFVERAARVAPDDPYVLWAQFRLHKSTGDFDAALPYVQRIHELVPDDYPTHLALASMLSDLDRVEEAEEHYEQLVAISEDVAGSWRVSSLYRYSNLLRVTGRGEEASEYLAEYQRLHERLGTPNQQEVDRGSFGEVEPSDRVPFSFASPRTTPALTQVDGKLAIEGPAVFAALPAGPPIEKNVPVPLVDRIPAPQAALFHAEPGGIALALRTPAGSWVSHSILAAPGARPLLALDLENDGDLDLVYGLTRAEGTELRILQCGQEEQDRAAPEPPSEEGEEPWAPWPREWWAWDRPVLGGLPENPALLASDFDHEGDLDLFVGMDEGLRLLRNDGAGEFEGSFTSIESPVAPARRVLAMIAEDFDSDNDVDYLLQLEGQVELWSNERSGRFRLASAELPAELLDKARLWPEDIDADGQPDLLAAGTTLLGATRSAGGGWSAPTELGATPLAPGASLTDWDGDGAVDLVQVEGSATRALLAVGMEVRTSQELTASRPDQLWTFDLDGDLDLDLVSVEEGKLKVARREGSGQGLGLRLAGIKDNERGVGAIVELRAREIYRRIYWRGEPLIVGLGGADKLDLLRITWPNGVIQNVLDLPAGETYRVRQREGLIGSCPFLYTWNGETYEFVSDVLGITPLGLPMGPGMLVPPDHDEYVLVRGDQMVPKDGFFEMQFTEELREVTYLDRIRLDVVDHPAEVEIYPNERFSFPPFPEAHTHTVRAPLSPERAVGSDGKDWTAALAHPDEELAMPFVPYRGQFLGLTDPHFLELSFDPERTRDAGKLRLLLTGWLYWTDASVNMASAHHPTISFVPPLLQVPDGEGGWRTCEPPIGFPAGKLKTMVVDVSEILDREDPRVRVFTTLRLYWDSIRLAVDEDDAPLGVTSLEPAQAELWERGFSRGLLLHGNQALEWFDWDELESEPRWNQHPGLYTRFGDVLPLLGEVDDRYCIMGSGDALTVRFDARHLPAPKPGWKRDFLVYLDGWAKDRDPNTHEALYVEPLPFHGMSAYPYGEDEAYPDTEEHRRFLAEWITRPARRWIEPVAQARPRPAH